MQQLHDMLVAHGWQPPKSLGGEIDELPEDELEEMMQGEKGDLARDEDGDEEDEDDEEGDEGENDGKRMNVEGEDGKTLGLGLQGDEGNEEWNVETEKGTVSGEKSYLVPKSTESAKNLTIMPAATVSVKGKAPLRPKSPTSVREVLPRPPGPQPTVRKPVPVLPAPPKLSVSSALSGFNFTGSDFSAMVTSQGSTISSSLSGFSSTPFGGAPIEKVKGRRGRPPGRANMSNNNHNNNNKSKPQIQPLAPATAFAGTTTSSYNDVSTMNGAPTVPPMPGMMTRKRSIALASAGSEGCMMDLLTGSL
jgi:hypothetical protein